jgi:GMP synthase (glutamine-hydrolysing)
MTRLNDLTGYKNALPNQDHTSGDNMQHFLIVKLGNTYPFISTRYGDFDDWIRSNLGFNPDNIGVRKPFAGEKLPDPRNVSGVVVTGSHAMVTDQENWSEYTAAWLQKVIETETPLLGICYGHQLLAHAMGGRVGPRPQGGEFGTVDVQLNDGARDDRLLASLPRVLQVQVCHSEFVLELPPGATLLASSARDPHLAFAYGTAAWGVQFHPEFDRDILISYIRAFSNTLLSEGQNPENLIRTASNTPYGKKLLRRFGEIVSENNPKAR